MRNGAAAVCRRSGQRVEARRAPPFLGATASAREEDWLPGEALPPWAMVCSSSSIHPCRHSSPLRQKSKWFGAILYKMILRRRKIIFADADHRRLEKD